MNKGKVEEKGEAYQLSGEGGRDVARGGTRLCAGMFAGGEGLVRKGNEGFARRTSMQPRRKEVVTVPEVPCPTPWPTL